VSNVPSPVMQASVHLENRSQAASCHLRATRRLRTQPLSLQLPRPLSRRADANVLSSGAVTTAVPMGTSAFNSRSIYGAVAMDSSYGWYTFGPGAAVSLSRDRLCVNAAQKPLSPPRTSQARSISYSTNAGTSATSVYAADVRRRSSCPLVRGIRFMR